MEEYKSSFFKNHRNTIILCIIFTAVFGFRIWYDYTRLQPVILPVLEKDFQQNWKIEKKDVTTKVFYKINVTKDMITSKDELVNMYAKVPIIKEYPILKKQTMNQKDKFGPLANLPPDRRIIPLPSDVNSSGINIGDKIEITSSPKKQDMEMVQVITSTDENETVFTEQEAVSQENTSTSEETMVLGPKRVYSLAAVIDKIDAKGISYDEKNSVGNNERKGNVPKVLMVEVSVKEAKDIEDAIARNENINVRLVPPSFYEREGVSLNENSSSS